MGALTRGFFPILSCFALHLHLLQAGRKVGNCRTSSKRPSSYELLQYKWLLGILPRAGVKMLSTTQPTRSRASCTSVVLSLQAERTRLWSVLAANFLVCLRDLYQPGPFTAKTLVDLLSHFLYRCATEPVNRLGSKGGSNPVIAPKAS